MGDADAARVAVVVGPTASGKTALVAALAGRTSLGVISADARQIYRDLDIGTAKPDAALRRRVPHYGIDIVNVGERYSSGRFARDAVQWLGALRAEGRWPIVAGGTGFYVRVLTEGLFREPVLETERRLVVRRWAERQPRGELARWATRLDPGFSGGGAQRAARAIEMAVLTGRPLSWWQRTARMSGIVQPWFVRLTLPRAELHRRIADRARAMVAAGILEETRRALAQGARSDAPGLDAIGYREAVAVLEGRLPPDELAATIAAATRRYAKRQETWFRRQLTGGPVWTLDATASPVALAEMVHARWEEEHP